MFFSRFFRKDAASLLEKGEKFMAAGRFADAMIAFDDALERLEDGCQGSADLSATIRGKKAIAGNRLAEMNIREAEGCIKVGEWDKGVEHLDLAIELADDPSIRERAEKLKAEMARKTPSAPHRHTSGGCGGCGGKASNDPSTIEFNGGGLSETDRFELLIRGLPGDLPERYAKLGEEFARGYLAANDGDSTTAEKTFSRLLAVEENDILLYEMSLLMYGKGDVVSCESMLRRALGINGDNPLCNITLAQLLTGSGRFAEAVPLLESMVQRGILTDQAVMFLGEIHRIRGEHDMAIDSFTRLLSSPLKREAAERLVVLLEENGRSREAAQVAKQYLKGCC